MSINQNKDFFYTKLAFHQANINLGSTKTNPSVGCIVVKNNSQFNNNEVSIKSRNPRGDKRRSEKRIKVIYFTIVNYYFINYFNKWRAHH